MRLLLPLLVLASAPASSCSCVTEWTEEAAYSRAENVAVVRIARVEQTDADTLSARGVVTEHLKGRKVKEVQLVGDSANSSCHYALQPGDLRVVFWSDRKAVFGYCSPQPLLSAVPGRILQDWRGEP